MNNSLLCSDDDIFAAPTKPKKKSGKKPVFEELLDDDTDLFIDDKQSKGLEVSVQVDSDDVMCI